jgi:hypothetical protein
VLAVVAAEVQGEVCSGSTGRCGNLTISDPFWLTVNETDRSCGYLDFEVTCYNNTPVLRSSLPFGFGFEIIDISYEEGSLRVIDLGKRESLHASKSCHVSGWNTSDKLASPFRISPVNLNLIFYNCTSVAATTAALQDQALVEMKCATESHTFVRVEGRDNGSENYERYNLEGCISTFLPVLGTSSEAKASNYEQLISDGFLLTWDPPLGSSKLTHPTVQFYFSPITYLRIQTSIIFSRQLL